MNKLTREHIKKLLLEDLRGDGRKLREYRKPVEVKYGISPLSAEGSAQVTLGDTVVMAGVKMDVGEPYPDTPEEGALIVSAELLPFASPEFESGPPSIDAIELSRVVDRGIRESKCVDMKKLCITKGEKVWTLFVDIYPINDAGNLYDAASLAAMAALKDAVLPELDKKTGKINHGTRSKIKLPLTKLPLGVTVIKIGDKLLVDPTHEEWACLDARLTVVTTDKGKVCAMQKGGVMPLSLEEIGKMVDLSIEEGKKLRKVL